ncbi:MAG: pyruvate dehydrogenase (acetyl-transferring) E1 component subunit alpha [Chloroflexota bacterium]|nr:pyruvate dehydrogenase (acetyl-transferring) E1 component subunit alpha [Chloroflexota bacterium]MDE2941217.1 pyruvate dehydrogenase (acetyl-transferring) E1 component subunit alpha [Chloroflexota bacterium]MDE3267200.1 pyruvate dehydrogenase (acetyl-transferring) E1 component subunit alpha [Chloroflexota bacterium]
MASGDKLDGAQLIDFYRRMLLIRVFEERSAEQYMLGRIRGFLHLYNGEEAIAVGAISSLQPTDYVVTHYRDHGHALAKGMDPNAAMAELFGKATGCSKGKGGSMHLFDLEKRFMGGHAIVGGQLPLSTGFALASKLRGDGDIALCFLGDGAINEGEFHESLNLASLWKLPVLFFVENNLYGMGATVEQMLAFHDEIYKFANGYKIPSVRIDGMDVLKVREATQEAIAHVRGGNGPFLIEAMAYRFRGHSMADPAEYRARSEEERWRMRDPITTFGASLVDGGTATQEELDEIRTEVEEIIDAAVQFAEDSPFPEPEALYDDVYGGM